MRRRRARVLAAGLAVALTVGLATLVRGEGPGPPGPQPEAAPGPMLVGFLDDVSFRWHPERAHRLDRAHATGARLIRAFVRWHLAAPTRPERGAPPFDVPRMYELDELVAGAEARDMEVLFTIWGTPGWANGGRPPSHAPTDLAALRDFARGLAERYPSVRRFAIWNEPNTELFLAPQFDGTGASVAPRAYAALYRAAHEGIKAARPDALVAIGETSSHGRDAPSPGGAQDSHSPVRFARLLADLDPGLPFDAWAHHPYPTRSGLAPDRPARWPAVTLTSLERFGAALDEWFARERVPLWLSEFGYEASPADPRGVPHGLQAAYAARAIALASALPRVELFVWFTFADDAGNDWQSGLFDRDGAERPAYGSFAAAVRALAVPRVPAS